MSVIETVLLLLLAMGVLLGIAEKINIAYPILLVIGGVLIGVVAWLTHVPTVELEPELIFLLFLPPIIQSAAFFTPIRDFKRNARPIGLLAIGLVIFTTVIIALIANVVVGLPLAVAFVLGAIIAPPDAVAATSVTSRLKVPRRIVTVLEGESLVNDATALTALAVAIAAVQTGQFSITDAGLRFVVTALGGIMVGIVVGLLTLRILRFLNDVSVTLIYTFLVAYGAYLLAEQVFHVSGVLANVVTGLLLGRAWRREGLHLLTPEARLQIEIVWESIISLFNGIVFILIGLQLPHIMEKVLEEEEAWTLVGYGLTISLATIILRIIWVYPATYIPRWLFRKIRERDPSPPLSYPTVIAWAGMRGVVSLAAALSLPLTLSSGAPFPGRDMVIFLTFCVILATLVMQGLSLPPLIALLKVPGDNRTELEEAKARWVAAKAGQEKLDGLSKEEWVTTELIEDLSQHYEERIRRFSARYLQNGDHIIETKAQNYVQLQNILLEAEYHAVVELRDKGIINDEVLHQVQRELDLERIRLNS